MLWFENTERGTAPRFQNTDFSKQEIDCSQLVTWKKSLFSWTDISGIGKNRNLILRKSPTTCSIVRDLSPLLCLQPFCISRWKCIQNIFTKPCLKPAACFSPTHTSLASLTWPGGPFCLELPASLAVLLTRGNKHCQFPWFCGWYDLCYHCSANTDEVSVTRRLSALLI